MNRRSIIVLLIGVISALAAFATIDHFRQQRCAELFGRWVVASRQCELSSGELVGTGTIAITLGGLFVGGALAIVLYRAFLFATGRAQKHIG